MIHRATLSGRPACGAEGRVRLSTSGVGVTCPTCAGPKLAKITPPLRPGQTVQCAKCFRMVASAKADLSSKAGTFYCEACQTVSA